MKEFFKNIWEAIKKFFSNIFSAVAGWLEALPAARYINFILGLVLTAFIALDLPLLAEWPAVPAAVLFILVGFIKTFCGKSVNWLNYLAGVLGALVIQIFSWIA